MRHFGIKVFGIRTPIIEKGDDLVEIVADSFCKAVEDNNIVLSEKDILGITEAVVAKAQGNYASFDDIALDVGSKFGGENVGVVFPILSRNRFYGALKGIAKGAEKVYVLLSYPQDEVGNPLMDRETAFDIGEKLGYGLINANDYKTKFPSYKHPFTDVDYIELYQQAGHNIEIYLSNDCRDILKLTKNVIAADIHTREFTKKRLVTAGAEKVLTLADILNKPVNGSGYNEKYGLLGFNLAAGNMVKLFPRDCETLIFKTREKIRERTGVEIEMLVYGDGAFKDPVCGIWELADPVVSPAYTSRLEGQPNEIKMKYVADNMRPDMRSEEKKAAVKEAIKQNDSCGLGTTPRKYADLIGSLCDLASGSGDKGTPIVLIQGYFDDYADE